MERQPAQINYFFKGGYIEFWRVIVCIFCRCGDVIGNCWEGVCDHAGEFWDALCDTFGFELLSFFPAFGHLFMLVFFFSKLLLNIVFTIPLCFLMSIFQAIFLLVLMFLFYILFLLVAFADWLYRSLKKIATSCPNCQERYDLPTYVCTCGSEHTRLVPSKYGAFARQCTCGVKLKTTFFNGRHKQSGSWICPKCRYELNGSFQVDIPIPVVGGPSAGKTCYISMAISEIEKVASRYRLDFEYKSNDALGDDYADNKQKMSRGMLPDKTSDMRLRYYQFYLTPKGEKVKNMISVCDVAGETYESNDEMGRQIGYKHANAFLMVVDPLSVTKFREEVSGKINVSKYRASEKPMDEVLNTLINTLENMKCITSKTMIKTDVAVVFTKCDIPGLEDRIGESGVMKYMQLKNITSKYDAWNKVCEQFLIDYEEENFLNSLKSKFKSIQFFTCSALGHPQDGTKFAPEGVDSPLLWLIDKASSSINLKEKWGKKI